MNDVIENAMEEMETVAAATEEELGAGDDDASAEDKATSDDAGDDKSGDERNDDRATDDDKATDDEAGKSKSEEPEGQTKKVEEAKAEAGEEERAEVNPVQKRINEISAKKRESDERADAAEKETADLKQQIAKLNADKLDPLDYEDDAEYDAAYKKLLGEPEAGDDSGKKLAPSDDQQARYWEVEEASNFIEGAGKDWDGAPDNYVESLQNKPFTDDVVVEISGLSNPAKVAYELAKRPSKLFNLGKMDANERKTVLAELDEAAGIVPGESDTDTDSERRQLKPVSGLKPAGTGPGSEQSMDDIQKQQAGSKGLW